MPPADLDTVRACYAAAVCRDVGVANQRVERAFAATPREEFLTPPPWRIFSPGGVIEKITADPADLYEDVLVVLDSRQGINNGQPSLHAAWLAALDPRPGETAVHVGIGAGYYTAILAALVEPGGRVHAYEIDPPLAAIARANLSGRANVTVTAASGLATELPPADVIDVNAGAAAPDPAWLEALKSGGRLVFPWQPGAGNGGVAMLVTRTAAGFSAAPLMGVGFIPLVGERRREARRIHWGEIGATRSLWLTRDRAPDETATAAYDDVWFSREPLHRDR